MAQLLLKQRSLVLAIILVVISSVQSGPPAKRSYTLPSVSDAHYQETLPDGSYKYAYTGEHRYVAERRLADGTVEGESLYIRPDGVPIKVHYFADGKGYRPKTEVLYKERLLTAARHLPVVHQRIVPEVRVVPPVHPAPVVIAGRDSARVNLVDQRSGQGVHLSSSNGGDITAAVPSVTAIVGPGSHAVIQPEAEAHSGNRAGFRSIGSGGDVSVANPQVTAIAGPGSSVVIAPKARATSGNPSPVIREVHHSPHVIHPPLQRVVPVPPKVIATHAQPHHGYVYAPPTRHFIPHTPKVVVPLAPKVYAPPPVVNAVHANGVLVIPPKPSYRYTYSYSAPDGKYPLRDNSAFVDVQVNH